MDAKELTALLAAVVGTLAEGGGWCTETQCYMLGGMDWDKWEVLRHALLRGGLVTMERGVVRLTPKGREMGDRVNAKLKELEERKRVKT